MKHVNPADLDMFWKDVDPKTVESLDQDQKSAILKAINRRYSDPERADVRLSLFGYYMVVLFGRERRSKQRLAEERRKRPLFTWKNLPVLLALWGAIFYTTISLVPRVIYEVLSLFV